MQDNRKKFKIPPKRFQPKGLEVVYEDNDILVVNKESGILSVGNEKNRHNAAFYKLTDYIRKGNSKSRNRLYAVASLNKLSSGILLFAKNNSAKEFLKTKWDTFEKKFVAVVDGELQEHSGNIETTLAENKQHQVYSQPQMDPDNFAVTNYKRLDGTKNLSLVEIILHTHRKHQIRVHFMELGHSVIGDNIYGKSDINSKRLLLHAESITIIHPFTKESLTLSAPVPGMFYRILRKF